MSNGCLTNLLLENYKFLWNHYKLQNEASEKRRNFLWVVESALILALYHFFDRTPFAITVIIIGMIISIIFFFVLRRDRESTFLTQEQLRDIEHHLNKINNEVIFNKFILDEKIHNKHNSNRGSYVFPHSASLFNEDKINNYWLLFVNNDSTSKEIKLTNGEKLLKKINECLERNIRCLKNKLGYKIFSVKYLLDYFTPMLFIMTWICFVIIYLHKLLAIKLFCCILLAILIIYLLYIFVRHKCYNK